MLLACCGSRRWARRLAEHRPYPDAGALLAAADEAGYDLTPAELSEAVEGESSAGFRRGGPDDEAITGSGSPAARTALRAAHAAYENRFGHMFIICLDGLRSDEVLGHVLAAIRIRLGHERDEERVVTADELRRIARGRIARLVPAPLAPAPPEPAIPGPRHQNGYRISR